MRRWLAVSLALNLALMGVGLFHARGHGIGWPKSRPAPVAEPSPQRLAEAPDQPWSFALERFDAARPAYAYSGQTGPAFDRWRQNGRAAFARTLGFAPRPFGGEHRITEVTTFEDHTRTRLYLKTSYGYWLSAYLLVPAGAGRRPAVLALPGHDGPPERGAQAVVGRESPSNYTRSFGRRLVEAGYVVLAIDVPGVGELEELYYQRLTAVGLLTNEPIKRLMLENAHQALDFLLARPEVDPAATGAMGMSLGGELAMFLAVLDDRVKFVGASGFFSAFKDFYPLVSPSLFIPGMLHVADVPDLAAMVAPRPMWLQVGETDRLVPAAKARLSFEKVQRAYTAAGAAKKAVLHVHPGGHVFDVPPALSWLKAIAPAGGN